MKVEINRSRSAFGITHVVMFDTLCEIAVHQGESQQSQRTGDRGLSRNMYSSFRNLVHPKRSSCGYLQWQFASPERRPNVVATELLKCAYCSLWHATVRQGIQVVYSVDRMSSLIALVRSLDLRVHP